jgi:hypothetical protein
MDLSREDEGANSPGAFLTVAQLARRWHISEHRLYQMRKSGEGPLFTIVGRIGVRYLVNAVVQYESTRTFATTSEFRASDRRRAIAVTESQKAAAKNRPLAHAARLAKAKSRKSAGAT